MEMMMIMIRIVIMMMKRNGGEKTTTCLSRNSAWKTRRIGRRIREKIVFFKIISIPLFSIQALIIVFHVSSVLRIKYVISFILINDKV
ncbi:hypothetical protein F8388_024275 [Cannabis sativa]|uniref:Uncharacterized protein n=1 Tax=Cannabis sativa TaxID=3483 RepID=A0A7J6E5T6_CANSA|nr:hypothetical protein F8388_024275 [Cannabis sativa]